VSSSLILLQERKKSRGDSPRKKWGLEGKSRVMAKGKERGGKKKGKGKRGELCPFLRIPMQGERKKKGPEGKPLLMGSKRGHRQAQDPWGKERERKTSISTRKRSNRSDLFRTALREFV